MSIELKMTNPLATFDFNAFQLKTNDTKPSEFMNLLKEFIESSQSNVSFPQQANIFLSDEQNNLAQYIEDITLHYVYKRIFNDAVIIYKEDSNEENFLRNFLHILEKQYVVNIVDDSKKEEFGKEMYLLIQAPKKSSLGKWSKRLKEHAILESEMNCYICGKKTEDKQRKDSILISDWLNYKESPFYENIARNMYTLLRRHKIKKSIGNKNKIINSIFEIIFNNITFEYFKREHVKAHSHFNELTMEIEHNFPKSWGGSKNLDNLFVSCHKCNQNKKDISFYTEYSISRFFSNKTNMEEAGKSLRSKLGEEAILSLKMKQKFKCINENCVNHFYTSKEFFIIKIDDKKGFYFFNLQIECYDCIKSKYIKKISLSSEKEFFSEFCIKL